MENIEAPSTTPEPIGVGARLKAAREAAGLSLGDVADRLKLSIRQLEALESDNFDALPGPAFVRGFVRNYARFLDLDSAPLMAALESRVPSVAKVVENFAHEIEAAQEAAEPTRRRGPLVLLGLLVVAGLAGAGWWWSKSNAEKPAVSNELAPMMAEQASAPVASAPVAASAPAVVASAPAATPAPAAKAKPAAVAQASAPAVETSGGEVKLKASADAWISVVDATGKKLVFQTLTAGTEKSVTGKPPIAVRIGNAPAVELSYNGQPVDLKSKTHGTTANVKLK
ncbi:helix-turn-helix domain-containing protein [Crenobacter sp. SG2305]|uniref:helix-turn-helix domain-containing protein n=1 Tax=Crenobacter oryzisoli TaxID=3056844 RepID=UPI0025AACCBB|nr:helix-turn-helix domain-containing protein [Crenobacter sp. SG2305]MDN0081380.1 helix-turn-helix domain-containing protein [Crenobacter sp. SG2305]